MVVSAKRLFAGTSRRVYNEIHIADWWWETQASVPRGGTVVPMLFASNKNHLTNLSGDKAPSAVYILIGNITKDLRFQGSKCAWGLVALLEVSQKKPKVGKIHRSWHQAISKG